jgi:hypothetical protein
VRQTIKFQHWHRIARVGFEMQREAYGGSTTEQVVARRWGLHFSRHARGLLFFFGRVPVAMAEFPCQTFVTPQQILFSSKIEPRFSWWLKLPAVICSKQKAENKNKKS